MDLSLNVILISLGLVIGIAYFAKRNHRRQRELKAQTKRARM